MNKKKALTVSEFKKRKNSISVCDLANKRYPARKRQKEIRKKDRKWVKGGFKA